MILENESKNEYAALNLMGQEKFLQSIVFKRKHIYISINSISIKTKTRKGAKSKDMTNFIIIISKTREKVSLMLKP